MAATDDPPFLNFSFFLIASNFSALMDARRSVRRTINGATGSKRVSIKKYEGAKSSASYRVIIFVREGTGWVRVHELS